MQSLVARHPRRIDVPTLLAASLALVTAGLTMPAMEINAWVFWRAEYSILGNIQEFFDDGKYVAAWMLLICSVAYPVGKILGLAFLLVAPFPTEGRRALIRLLRLMGRWSMVDVAAMAVIVIGSQGIFMVDARPRPGIYLYAAGIFTLAAATVLMDRMTRKGLARRGTGRSGHR